MTTLKTMLIMFLFEIVSLKASALEFELRCKHTSRGKVWKYTCNNKQIPGAPGYLDYKEPAYKDNNTSFLDGCLKPHYPDYFAYTEGAKKSEVFLKKGCKKYVFGIMVCDYVVRCWVP